MIQGFPQGSAVALPVQSLHRLKWRPLDRSGRVFFYCKNHHQSHRCSVSELLDCGPSKIACICILNITWRSGLSVLSTPTNRNAYTITNSSLKAHQPTGRDKRCASPAHRRLEELRALEVHRAVQVQGLSPGAEGVPELLLHEGLELIQRARGIWSKEEMEGQAVRWQLVIK